MFDGPSLNELFQVSIMVHKLPPSRKDCQNNQK